MTGRRALVTGAAGFIGSHLVDRLLSDGWEVIGIDSYEDYYPRHFKQANLSSAVKSPKFQLVESTIGRLSARVRSETSTLESLMTGMDVVFHLAAQAGVRASWGRDFAVYTTNNVLATQLLLEQALISRPSKFVYASSSSVYGDTSVLPMREDAVCRPFSPYGVTKLAAEHLCGLYERNFSLPAVSLRFFTVYGPRQRPDMAFHRFTRAALDARPVLQFDDGSQTRDFTFVGDIVDGLIAAAECSARGVYNLGGGSRVTLSHVLGVLGDVMGAELAIEVEPRQSGDVRDTWACIDAARRDLGYEPKTSLEDGLRAEIEWLKGMAGAIEKESR